MLTALNQQIITAYEECGLDIDQIAEEFSVDELAVKATLMQFSVRYRDNIKSARKNGEVSKADFTDNDLEESAEVLRQMMHSAEDENLRVRCARYIRDDKKGRLDALSGLKSLNMNIAIFNQRLLQAREAKERSKQLTDKVVEVEVVETK